MEPENWNEGTNAFDDEKALAFYTAIIDVCKLIGSRPARNGIFISVADLEPLM
jgi:hypothetical protein